MSSKPIRIPGPDHPITITPTRGRVTVVVNGKRVADTREALTLKKRPIRLCNTSRARTSTRRSCNGHRIKRIVPTRANAPITAFLPAANARSTRSGLTRLLTPPYRLSASTSRFTRTESMPSKSALKLEMATAMKMLTGKIALVTGASRGIGRAGALALGRAGARVLVHYARAEEQADAVVAEIRLLGGNAEKASRRFGFEGRTAPIGPAGSGHCRRAAGYSGRECRDFEVVSDRANDRR